MTDQFNSMKKRMVARNKDQKMELEVTHSASRDDKVKSVRKGTMVVKKEEIVLTKCLGHPQLTWYLRYGTIGRAAWRRTRKRTWCSW